MDSEKIIDLYERHAEEFDKLRSRSLFERNWLDAFRNQLAQRSVVLDLGCGMGQPIAEYLVSHGTKVVGVDSSQELIEKCRRRLPEEQWIVGDMRSISLARRFQGIIAWDSFFHLTRDDQREMFPIFAAHIAPGGLLLFTSGTSNGEAIGDFCGEPLYHSSLSPEEYRECLSENGFEVISYVREDPTCGFHTVWLARAQVVK